MFILNQNYLYDLLKWGLLGTTPEFLIWYVLTGAWELIFLTRSEVILLLLIQALLFLRVDVEGRRGSILIQRGGRRLSKEDRNIHFTGWALLVSWWWRERQNDSHRKVTKTSIFSIHSVLGNKPLKGHQRILCNHYLASWGPWLLVAAAVNPLDSWVRVVFLLFLLGPESLC